MRTEGEMQTTVRRDDTFVSLKSSASIPVRLVLTNIDPAAVSSLARRRKLLYRFCE